MKKYIFLLLVGTLFISCNSSKKGKWSQSDLDKCKSEIIIGMKSFGADEDAVYDEIGMSMDDIASCVCENVEKDYASFEEADSQLLGAGEEDLEKLFFTCVDIPTTLNSNGSQIGNWSQSDLEKCKFEIINGMKSSGADETAVYEEFGVSMDEISSCVCYKVEKEYGSFEEADSQLLGVSDEDLADLFFSCVPQ